MGAVAEQLEVEAGLRSGDAKPVVMRDQWIFTFGSDIEAELFKKCATSEFQLSRMCLRIEGSQVWLDVGPWGLVKSLQIYAHGWQAVKNEIRSFLDGLSALGAQPTLI